MMQGKDGAKFFGHGLPYADIRDLKGTLITIEGTDGVGRTTQVNLLREWLGDDRRRQGGPQPEPADSQPAVRDRFRRPP